MTELLNWIIRSLLFSAWLFSATFIIYSVIEKEKSAALKMLPISLVFVAILVFSFYTSLPEGVQFSITTIFCLALSVLVIRFGNRKIDFSITKEQFDERDVIFSRVELEKGSQKFNDYYRQQPQNKPKDDAFRQESGLLHPGTKFYHPLLFKATDATFSTVNLLNPLVESQPLPKPEGRISEVQILMFIRNWTKKLGAHSVGFTELKPHHIYSHGGRGERYGQPIILNHKFAIAFTVEMDHRFIQQTPHGPVIMESSQQYLNAGQIAVQLAQFIRSLGYEARAHIDTNYQVICPVVAQDAGLGTIGRMGLLMTPKLGPRVRIAVVTTNQELKVSAKPIDSSVLQFCALCKKCAVNCPSQAISFQTKKTSDNWNPWKINHEKCFTYWTKAGTDCGRCIAVCPFAHPNNIIHNMIRWLLRRNKFNRWLVFHLDNIFYGKKPKLRKLLPWME